MYNSTGSFDYSLLIYSLLINLAFEIITDTICWRYESRDIDMVSCWKSIARKKKFTRRLLPFMLVSLTGGLLFLTYGLQDTTGGIDCHYVTTCLPYPCECYSPASTLSLGNITTADNSTSHSDYLSPFFLHSCELIATNRTGELLRDTGFYFQQRWG